MTVRLQPLLAGMPVWPAAAAGAREHFPIYE
jgi:hypothetical protein